jgi:hypothetical protein
MPARHIYREVRPHLIDGMVGNAFADAVLAAWPRAPRYFAVPVTRTWQKVPNFSIQLPRRKLVLQVNTGPTIELPIPAHGVVYVPQAPANPAPSAPQVFIGGLAGDPASFLDGRTAQAWKQKAQSTTIVINFADAAPNPHVILRRPMREEILADPVFPAPKGLRCTYMSLRRATRAFVDHRLTGGRLVHEKGKTQSPTKELMKQAWNEDSAKILVNNKPLPSASPGKARDLEKIWQLFFPDTVPAQVIDASGSTDRTVEYDGGRMMYALWQVNEDEQRGNGTKRNFENAHVGTGAPGAIVAVALSGGYLVKPPHDDPDPSVITDNVNEMLTLLTPGCVLQFWDRRIDYARVRTRSATAVDRTYGHSPLFRKYMPLDANGVPTGIVVIDQFGGDSKCPLVGEKLKWGSGDGEDIWIAAQWDE